MVNVITLLMSAIIPPITTVYFIFHGGIFFKLSAVPWKPKSQLAMSHGTINTGVNCSLNVSCNKCEGNVCTRFNNNFLHWGHIQFFIENISFPTVWNVVWMNIAFILKANDFLPFYHLTISGVLLGTGDFGWGRQSWVKAVKLIKILTPRWEALP